MCIQTKKIIFLLFFISITFDVFADDSDIKPNDINNENEKHKINTDFQDPQSQIFKKLAEKESLKYIKKSIRHKTTSTVMFFIGSLALTTGAILFIHDKAGGTNSLSTQYSLILGGLSLIDLGIAFNASSFYSLNKSESYLLISRSGSSDQIEGKSISKYYESSGFESRTKKMSSKSLKKNGAALMLMSIPMFAIAIYGFFDSYNYILRKSDEERDDESWDPDFVGLDILVGHLYQIFSLLPAATSLTFGVILLAKSYKYEKLSTEPSLFTLNSITPIINPVSKTYGLALGFSF